MSNIPVSLLTLLMSCGLIPLVSRSRSWRQSYYMTLLTSHSIHVLVLWLVCSRPGWVDDLHPGNVHQALRCQPMSGPLVVVMVHAEVRVSKILQYSLLLHVT